MTLANDATLADVAETLLKPDRYVRLALKNMYDCEREYGPVVLRIGRMGTGQIPHYRSDKQDQNLLFDYTMQLPVQSYNGRSHKLLVPEGEEADILRDEHWSRAGMSRNDVAELLGRIRKGEHYG